MATVKVLGMYPDMPLYGMKSLLIWVCFGLPFLPIFLVYGESEMKATIIQIAVYFPLYLIQTFLLGIYISRIGRQWSLKEYDKLTTDQVTFPFLLALGLHGLFHYVLFSLINQLIVG